MTYQQTSTTTGRSVVGEIAATESSRRVGVAGLFGLDAALADLVLPTVATDIHTVQVWRATTTPVLPALTDLTAATRQTTRVRRVDAGVRLLAETGPKGGAVYSPGLLELPADAAPGASWASDGTARAPDGVRPYRSRWHARNAASGCLSVDGELHYAETAGHSERVITLERTWCPGQGITAEHSQEAATSTSTSTSTSAVPSPAPRPIETRTAALTWTTRGQPPPAGWRTVSVAPQSGDPAFGDGPMLALPAAQPPVLTRSGVVVRAVAGADDLVGFQRSGSSWHSCWRAHPGGTVLTLSAFGDVLLATTTNRQVVAYDASGVRLWQQALSDLGSTPAVRTGPDAAMVVDLAGRAWCFDLISGIVRWRRDVGADVSVAPAVDGAGAPAASKASAVPQVSVVSVLDRGATLTGLDAVSGSVRWSRSAPGTAVATAGGVTLVLGNQSVDAWDSGTGRHRWVRRFPGAASTVVAVGNRFLVTGSEGSLLYDGAGSPVRPSPAYLSAVPVGEQLLGWRTDALDLLDPAGSVVATWPLPDPLRSAPDRTSVADTEGLWLCGPTWEMVGLIRGT